MSDPNTITASETPPAGQPVRPPGLGAVGKARWAVRHPPLDPTVSFAGKTVLLTGANTGLGFEAAVKYSALGADRIILGVRSADKGESTKARILARTPERSPDSISYLIVDLSTFSSVQAFCTELEKHVGDAGLDVALLCAGVAPPAYKLSPEGFDMVLQVNVLSTTLMAGLLVPLLRRTAKASGRKPHLTFVNSTGNDMVKRDWFDKHGGSAVKMANDPKAWHSFRTYTTSKLIGLAPIKALAETLAPGGASPEIIVNAVCPGLCRTDIGRDFPWIAQVVMSPVQHFFYRTAEQGARSLVSATALGPESHGKLWHNDILYPMNELTNDDEFMKRTLDEVMDVVNKVPGVNFKWQLVGKGSGSKQTA